MQMNIAEVKHKTQLQQNNDIKQHRGKLTCTGIMNERFWNESGIQHIQGPSRADIASKSDFNLGAILTLTQINSLLQDN